MPVVFSSATAELAHGIATHDRLGHLAGIVGAAVERHVPDRWCGRHECDRRNVGRSGLGALDAHSRQLSMTAGRILPHSAPVLFQQLGNLGITPSSQHHIIDFGCECGSLINYAANYLRCRGVGFEVEPSRAEVARTVTADIEAAWPTSRVSIIEADFLTFPSQSKVELITIAIISDLKFDPRVVTLLIDELVNHCPHLLTIVKMQVLPAAHSAHFHMPVVVPLECSWSSNPVPFLIYQRRIMTKSSPVNNSSG